MNSKKAITDKDKDRKRQLIVDTAAILFEQARYKDIKIVDIARRAGVAKGTVFFYFKTKEELFIELAKQVFNKFFIYLNGELRRMIYEKKELYVDDFINFFEKAMESSTHMVRLSAIINVMLEQNIEYDTARHFKVFMYTNILQTGELLETCMPSLGNKSGSLVLFWIYTLVIGLQHITDPSPVVREVMENENMQLFRPDFNESFREIVKTLLNGLKN